MPIIRLRFALSAALLLGALSSTPALAGNLFTPTPVCPPNASCPPGPITPPVTPPGTCGPGPSGAPCGGSGPATIGNASGTNQGVGNPLNVINGNKYQREVDLPALPGVLGLELVRHYNSAWRGLGQSGYGWRLSYETDLFVVRNTVQIRQADGTELIFNRDPKDPSVCSSANPANGRILINATPRGEEFVWQWTNGRKLAFDKNGKLESIAAPGGEFVTLQHGPKGELLKVTDPQGRSLQMEYGKPGSSDFKGIVAIQSPIGRFVFQHNMTSENAGAGNLVSVTTPQGSVRRYHYGADAGETAPNFPHHLTGISLEVPDVQGKASAQRLNTWSYDINGRGILSVKGLPRQTTPDGQTKPGTGIEQVNLDFSQSGKTVLTNSLGQRTTYSHAIIGNAFRLLEVRGAGCASCGEVNMRYGYDKLGRLTEQTALNLQGQPLRTIRSELDGLGRPSRVIAIDYENNKPQAARLLVRYEYAGDSTQPLLVAQPSVVSGKEHQTRTTYNTAGQPLSVTESGFSPMSMQGQPLDSANATAAANATPIARTTTYRYSTINGRSVLTQIDGPLKNGPKGTPEDSDITVLDYDPRANYLVAVTTPGNFKTSYEHDLAGRVVSQATNDGLRQVQSNFSYPAQANIANEPERIVRSGWLLLGGKPDPNSRQTLQVLNLTFDAMGHPVQSTDSAGRITRYQYDGAARMLGVADARGYRSQLTLDTEGQTQMAGLYLPGQQDPAKPYRAVYKWHDELGRLTQRLLPDGSMDSYIYDADGQLSEHRQSHGEGDDVLHSYRTNATKTAQAHIAQSTDGWLHLNLRSGARGADGQSDASASTNLIDDFGRVVQQHLPVHGNKTARFDEAGRITNIHSADGSSLHFEYDSAARLVQRSYQASDDKPRRVLAQLSYQGLLLGSITDPAQTVRYHYDALGRETGEEIALAGLTKAAGSGTTSANNHPAKLLQTATRYDPTTGLITARVLADGRVLRTLRGAADTGASAQVLILQAPWAAWLQDQTERTLPDALAQLLVKALPTDTIAQDITVHPFDGMTGYQSGNRLRTAKQFDLAGRMTELKTEQVSTLKYSYGVGPRIAKINDLQYHYRGFRTLALTDGMPTQDTAVTIKTGANSASNTGAGVTFDQLGRTATDARYRYTYTDASQVQTVSELNGKPIAQYAYNSLNQRVSKTVGSITTYYLWQNKHLVAELDANGHITSQYLYLSEGQIATPLAKLESADNPDNGSQQDRILFIHSDHRATPMAMTDAKRHIVWRANISPRGMMQVAQPLQSELDEGQANQATLNIRLSGQYFDAETGLHDNWHRTYNPATGRYLQPDPLGYPDGPDAYVYASGDPINKMDPLGLYQEDIHYYMTYFLAVMAGVSEKDALVMALGAQYVDDNPFTWPLNPNAMAWSYLTHPVAAADRLAAYHFTQSGYDPQRIERWYVPTDAERVAAINAGNPPLPPYFSEPDDVYAARRIKDPHNPQLDRLLAASGNAPGPCSKTQLFGEYLHAFEDTFGHRNKSNESIDVNLGLGHAFYGEQPDFTYNDSVYLTPYPGAIGNWNMREARTLEMETEVFANIQSQFGTTGKDKLGRPIAIGDIKGVLAAFNAIHENEGTGFTLKRNLLDTVLKQYGFGPIPAYRVADACKNRQDNLKPIIDLGDTAAHSQFPGVILGTPTQCPTTRGELTR